MTSLTAPMCMLCKHFKKELGFVCDAFPDRIPDDIIHGKDHSEPYPGDHGIQFEQMTDAEIESAYGKKVLELNKKFGLI